MNDCNLERLLVALDAATEHLPEASSHELHGDVELAALRLETLTRHLGERAQASPYLAFIRRTMAVRMETPSLAASA